MNIPPIFRLAFLLAVTCCFTALVSNAQVTYQGLIEGVYPTRLVIEQENPKAVLSISSLSSTINFIGGCNGASCTYRGIDTSMALVFEYTAGGLVGSLQDGEGKRKSLIAERIVADAPFASSCDEEFWLRSWSDNTEKRELVIATLPGKQVKGSFFMSELGASFSVSGTQKENALDLTLSDSRGNPLGSLNLPLNDKGNSLSAVLHLDGSTIEIAFDLTQEMGLTCLQAAGRYDMIYPNVEASPYAKVPVRLWKTIVSDRSEYGHVWFEPTRFDEHLVSGWLHRESPQGQMSEAINLLRRDGKFKQGGLLGGKRTKTQLLSIHKAQAVEQHPLHADEDFQSWAASLEFSKFALTSEGLAIASERHPIYGQLQSIVAWRELPKPASLPTWLTQ